MCSAGACTSSVEAPPAIVLACIVFWCGIAFLGAYTSCSRAPSHRAMAAMARIDAGLSPIPTPPIPSPAFRASTSAASTAFPASTVSPAPGCVPVLPLPLPLSPAPAARLLILSVEGVIGAGKSTLLSTMAKALGRRVWIVQEGVDLWRALPDPDGRTHNLLDYYYTEPAKYAMPFQTFTLATRVTALADALAAISALPRESAPDLVLVERSSSGDACFAQMLAEEGVIDAAWYAAYKYVRALYSRFVPDVDGIIDMNVDVDTAMTRLHERARGEEVGVTAAYQAHLLRTIRGWLTIERRPVLTLNAAEWDGSHVDDGKATALVAHLLDFVATVRTGAR